MAYTNPLLTTLFTLNKSWSKNVIVGLEYEDIEDQIFKPMVRLIAKDYDGIAFDQKDWEALKGTLEDN